MMSTSPQTGQDAAIMELHDGPPSLSSGLYQGAVGPSRCFILFSLKKFSHSTNIMTAGPHRLGEQGSRVPLLGRERQSGVCTAALFNLYGSPNIESTELGHP